MCQSCADDADSGNHSGVELVERKLQFHSADKGAFKENPSKRFLSVELEIASSDEDDSSGIDRALRRWGASCVEDGSLPDSGYEINSSPANGDKFCEQVDDICSALNDASAVITEACGYHVHIDARDFRYADIARLMRLYSMIESALFAMVPKSRRNSRYCKECGQVYGAPCRPKSNRDIRHDVARKVYGISNTRGRKDSKYHSARYSALNCHSWFLRGTVECRLASGSTNADKIKAWAILWAAIVDYADKATDKQIKALGDKTSQEILSSIAPNDAVRQFITDRTNKFA